MTHEEAISQRIVELIQKTGMNVDSVVTWINSPGSVLIVDDNRKRIIVAYQEPRLQFFFDAYGTES